MATTTDTINGYIDVHGAQLYYELKGGGDPLVLIHARLLHSGQWDEQFQALAAQYKVIRYDVRGYGHSRMIAAGSDVDDLRELLQTLFIRKAHLVGLGMGADIALNFALEYPQIVLSLALVSPELDDFEYSPAAMQAWQRFTAFVRQRDFQAATNAYIATWVDGYHKPALSTLRARVRTLLSAYEYAHYFPSHPNDQEEDLTGVFHTLEDNAVMYAPISERLRTLPTPTLIMLGGDDQPDILAIGEMLQRHLPNAQRVTLPGVTHLVNLQHPQTFLQVLTDFLDSLKP